MRTAALALAGLAILASGVLAAIHAPATAVALLAALAFACIALWAGAQAVALRAPSDLTEPREHPTPSSEPLVPRSGIFGPLFAAVAAAFGVVALVPLVSLGRRPHRPDSAWKKGDRLVTPQGHALRVDDVPVGGAETVFPEGRIGAPQSAVVLVRVPDDAMQLPPDRQSWVPHGNAAFSKICTHAGCPVAIYRKASYELYCPCHQSLFSVIFAAKPVGGPATRPLPQLPLAVDRAGYLVADGSFDAPVGPDYWWRPA